MSKDAPMKSAYELAMERLKAEDKQAAVEAPKKLTHEQKETIADLRQRAKAKLAEIEILHQKELATGVAEPEQLTKLEERYETDRRRAERSMESAIERVRNGEDPSG